MLFRSPEIRQRMRVARLRSLAKRLSNDPIRTICAASRRRRRTARAGIVPTSDPSFCLYVLLSAAEAEKMAVFAGRLEDRRQSCDKRRLARHYRGAKGRFAAFARAARQSPH